MKLISITAAAAVLLTGCTYQAAKTGITDVRVQSPPVVGENVCSEEDTGYEPLNYPIQKGMWLSYIDLAPMLSAEDTGEFSGRFEEACNNISELGCNTIYVHVRPFGDALYESQLFPPSEYICGEYDPLEIICDIAHEKGLSVHAWINPLRLQTADKLSQIEGFSTAEWYLEDNGMVQAVDDDSHLWLDPAYPEVRKLIADGAAEIVKNYQVDGIHYDDYFYPTTDEDFDAECFAVSGGGSTLEEWRTENISQMCREIYESVKNINEKVEVEISPQGNIENNYEYLYADVRKWCSEEGFCDRIIPQIYFGYENPVKPFISTLEEWQDMCSDGQVSLSIGLAVYKIGEESEYVDDVGIIGRQIGNCAGCKGVSLYTYNSLFGEDTGERACAERKAVREALALY
ncbi:family 10 glycosylhydrolase [Ruminococcus sp.]|uniref:glycoside hydrolase family 10 protein n=1 Tax=Ruminococcus sp. TaxID=41978 RepID=UPI0025F5FADD|nr:family 10 glycosylhydrolase [Ruminococcus sp.]MBQ8965392.1 family 10 glycosylhydrolase [Ruminococcus sp.]